MAELVKTWQSLGIPDYDGCYRAWYLDLWRMIGLAESEPATFVPFTFFRGPPPEAGRFYDFRTWVRVPMCTDCEPEVFGMGEGMFQTTPSDEPMAVDDFQEALAIDWKFPAYLLCDPGINMFTPGTELVDSRVACSSGAD